MNDLSRRNFLKNTCLGGVLLLSEFAVKGFCDGQRVEAAETVKEIKLEASVTPVNLGGDKSFNAWTYNGQIPGPTIRIKEGETLRVI